MKSYKNAKTSKNRIRIIFTIAIVLGSLSLFCKLPTKYTTVVLYNDLVIKDTLYTAPLFIICSGDDCFQQSSWATNEGDVLWSRTYILEDDNDSDEMYEDAIHEILDKQPETQHFYVLWVGSRGSRLINYGYSYI